MRRLHWPSTTLVSGMAALTTWVALLAWTPFSEVPSTYMVPLFASCLLVAAVGALLRSARLPAVLVVLVQLLVVAVWLHHRWAGGAALGGWIPTPESLRELNATLSASLTASQAYAAPVPRSVTDFAPLMILAGSATAVIVDFLAAGLRRAPVAGLPLLAVYTAPVSILDGGVSWVKFAAAGLCFLFLLASQESVRLAHWGHQVSGSSRLFDSQSTHVSSQAVWSSARKIGFTATGIAVVVPILVPTFSVALFGGNGNGLGGDGDSVSLSNPIVNMRRDLSRGEDVDLVALTTSDPDPSYLRVSVLDSFDGETWRPSGRDIPVQQRAAGLVPRPPGLDAAVARKTWPWTIDVTRAFKSSWLPAPYPVFSINAPGDWRYDRDTLDFISAADDQTTAGLTYDLEAIDIEPTAEQLADAAPAPSTVFGPNTELPDGVPDPIAEMAKSITDGEPSSFEQARALQRWFRVDGGFEYSVQRASGGNGLEQIEEFVSEDGRVGYCEQFATAMALMGRSLGIPSRVAVGFLTPEPLGGDRYVYSAHDLHAWPEMYFEGIGWVRFEPTPGVRTGAAPGYTRATIDRGSTTRPERSEPVLPSQNRFDTAAPADGGGSGAEKSRIDTGLVLGVGGGALAAVVLALLPRTTRTVRRRRRWDQATTPGALAEAAWAELRATAVDLRLAWDDAVTVRTRARELVRSFGVPGSGDDALTRASTRGPRANPTATAALEHLVKRVELARYSRTIPASAAVRAEVESDLEVCVAALRAGSSRQVRTRATWLPASLWSRWSAGRRPEGRVRDAGLTEPGVDHAV